MRYHLGLLLSFCLLAAGPRVALAHPGQPPAPHDVWTAWAGEPSLILGLAATLGAYGLGVRRLWRRAGRGQGVGRGQAIAFGVGWLMLVVALVSPIDALGEALFSAHMVQHLLLVLVAAPLLALGAPLVALVWALPRAWRLRLRGWRRYTGLRLAATALTQPILVWTLHTVALWVWHLPGLYQAALQNELVHSLEHGSFLGTAVLFWWVVVQPGQTQRWSQGASVLYLFAAGIQGSVLGALMTFAPTPWYPAYATTTTPWGLTPLADQQLAGAIMWVPAGTVYVLAAVWMFFLWLQSAERQTQQAATLEHSRARRREEGQVYGLD